LRAERNIAGVAVGVLERRWRPDGPLDLARTLAPHRRGTGDPTQRHTPDGLVWRASLTPDGPGSLCLQTVSADGTVHARAYGSGAEWLLERVPDLLGAADDRSDFAPEHPFLRRAGRLLHAVRIGRTGRLFEALVPAVLEQKVVGSEARRAWRLLVRRYGTPAPGPGPDLYVPPSPRDWQRVPSWEWHRAGVEAVRARTIIAAAGVADRLDGHDPVETDRRLRTIRGIGVWTSAEIRQRALGDLDAVSVGDFHLARLVGWTLAGRIVDDDGMLELLKPYAGHRYQAVRLIELAGSAPPARGPKVAPRDYRRI
jgi:3-methyladenine DNA glycosylase/8-oxoguanine DNA glycosylase